MPDRDAVIARVRHLLDLYGSAGASAADLLCDSHDPAALAYRIVQPDLSHEDISYGSLREGSERFAGVLAALGVRPGDRVATLMGKSRDYLVCLMGLWRIGAVHVPLFTAFASAAIVARLEASGTKLVLCDEDQEAKLPVDGGWHVVTRGPGRDGRLALTDLMEATPPIAGAAAFGGDHPLIHIFTSGTTGTPKPVVVPVRALASFRTYGEFALDLRPDDLYWCAGDPGWAYGLYFGILCSFTTATPSLLAAGRFSADFAWDVLARFGVTNFAAAPTIYRSLRLEDRPGIALGLRCASSAGEPLTPDLNQWAPTALGVSIHDHFGQTEAGMLINDHHNVLVRQPTPPGSMGQAMPGWRAAILDEQDAREIGPGEVGRVAMDLRASPLAWFPGYHGEPERSAARFTPDGNWYLTGDVGHRDEAGNFYFRSRDDDVILMAGYRIGPAEIEAVLVLHPSVAECAIIAVPDERNGEVVEAFVAVAGDVAPTDALVADLQSWVKREYAAHAYPRRISFIDALPRTPSGKVQRNLLKQRRIDEIAAHGADAFPIPSIA